MNVHALIFWTLWAAWLIMEVVVNLRARSLRKRSSTVTAQADQGSVWILLGGMYLLIYLAFLLSTNQIGLMPLWVPYVGNGVMALGIFVRYSAITQLGRYFSSTVQIATDQPVIDIGWYRRIRHPAYTGGWLIAVGVGLSLDTWVGTLIIGLGLLALYYQRICVEEQALVQHLGSAYASYRQRTDRMFPGIW